MKYPVIAFLALLLNTNLFAQKEIPAYGKIDEADIKITQCDFDKDANAYILLQTGELSYSRGIKYDFRIQISKRVRIKILQQNGIDYANVKIKFYSKDGYETIRDVKGITYNIDDKGAVSTTKLESKNVYTQKIDNKYSQVIFTMPDIRVGSVFEFKYDLWRESETQLENWYFQDELPVKISRYNINIPEFYKFTSQTFTNSPLDTKDDERIESVNLNNGLLKYKVMDKTFTMKNIPGVRYEPHMTTPKDYMQRMEFQLSAFVIGGQTTQINSSWDKLIASLKEDEEFGRQLQKNLSNTDDLKEKLNMPGSQTDKMNEVYDYVRNTMQFNGSYTFWSSDGIKNAWGKHTGTSGDINLILVNLLKDAGLEVYPLLVSSRDHVTINRFYPFINQFNNILAYGIADGKIFILDGTDKYNPSRLIPFDYLNTSGFLINKDGSWITIENNAYKYKQAVSVAAEITDSGILKGNAYIQSKDYAKNTRQQKWQNNKEKFSNYFKVESYPDLKIGKLEVKNSGIDSLPLDQTFDFEGSVNSSGEYKYFTANMFLNLDKNPFTADERFSDINFGYLQHYQLFANFKLPDGYVFEELPKDIFMILPDTSITFKRNINAENDNIAIKISIEQKRTYYPADEYLYIKEFYKRMFDLLNEQIVIKKINK